MDLFVGDKRPHHRHPRHDFLDSGKKIDREVNAGIDLADHEILGNGGIIFKVERIQMADGARNLVENHVTGIASRVYFTAGIGGAHFGRPGNADRSSRQAHTAIPEQIAPGGHNIGNGLDPDHPALPTRSYTETPPDSTGPTARSAHFPCDSFRAAPPQKSSPRAMPGAPECRGTAHP